jgi:hypothetical protein
VPPAKPAQLELAFYLRRLRVDHWKGSKLTQATLARALGGKEPLASATVASWENRSQHKLPPTDRLLAYAQFFATRRSLEGTEPTLVPVDSFTAEEHEEYERLRDELLRLHTAASGTPPEAEIAPVPRSWYFPGTGPVTLICGQPPSAETPEMARLDNPNYSELLSFSDLDAMVELFGHVRAENPSSLVTFKSAPNVIPDHLTGHLGIIGGIGWNRVTARLLGLARLPLEQREDPADTFGEIFIMKEADKEKKFLATWSSDDPPELIEDIGLLVRMPNPLNAGRTLTICNGIHSRGVLGAVRSLTDAQLRESNERYIANNLPGKQFGILMRVQVIEGQAMTPDFSNPRTILHQWSVEA